MNNRQKWVVELVKKIQMLCFYKKTIAIIDNYKATISKKRTNMYAILYLTDITESAFEEQRLFYSFFNF